MSIDLGEQDQGFLLQLIRDGEATLVLGAGATFGSINSERRPVLLGNQLAKRIAEAAGQNYSGETLTEVLGGISDLLSQVKIQKIYESEYRGVIPSNELSDLFKYTWKRVYTWNIDDSIQNVTERSAQRRRYYNGIADRVADYESKEFVHIVYLHGQVQHPEKGLIMSETDYSRALSQGGHRWYARAAQDYLAHNPIFIGSQLNEPILKAELDRAMREADSTRGRAYLVTPDVLTDLQRAKFRNQGIVHIRATLSEFVAWLQSQLPGGLRSTDVLAQHAIRISRQDLDRLTIRERESAWALKRVRYNALQAELSALPAPTRALKARRFLRGFAADWLTAASDIPVWLEATNGLYDAFSASVASHDRLFSVLGQAGSGKTTATLQCLIRYAKEHPEVLLYELGPDVRSPRSALSLLDKLHDQKVIVYVADLFLWGDGFAEDLQVIGDGKITIVATARLSEWRERLQRHLGDAGVAYIFQKFGPKDFEPLIDRIVKYVPAPKFVRMDRESQVLELRKSKSQLLIALREATESKNFDDIISNEYDSLPDEDTKSLLLVVGLGTFARVGISLETAREVYEAISNKRTFAAALAALDGIVNIDANGRLSARHELYVRHVFDELIDFHTLKNILVALLRSFTKYKVPVIQNVNRRDAQVFRFIINHDFILRRARISRVPADGIGVYEEFEVEFQLDGHYWLQYGLYLAQLHRTDEALQMLRRSIQAYPGNGYAVHAYADLQLKVALRRPNYDKITSDLVQGAVSALLEEDARRQLSGDQYPIVTLANGHLGVLIKFGLHEEARRFGSGYFDRLQQVERRVSSPQVQWAKERVFKYMTLGEWPEDAVPQRERD